MKKIKYRYLTSGGGEYQVVQGRKILGRYDTLKQATTAHPQAEHDLG